MDRIDPLRLVISGAVPADRAEAMSDRPLPVPEDLPQYEVDDEIIRLVRENAYCPEELLGRLVAKWDRAGIAARDLDYAKLRATLADAMEKPSPANFQALAETVIHCARMAMDGTARDSLRS